MTEVRWQKSDGRGQMEVGSRKWEVGMRKYKTEGIGCGLRPVGAIGAYAPEGSGNAECGNIGQRELNSQWGMRNDLKGSWKAGSSKQMGLNCGAERPHYSMFNVGRSMFDVHL